MNNIDVIGKDSRKKREIIWCDMMHEKKLMKK